MSCPSWCGMTLCIAGGGVEMLKYGCCSWNQVKTRVAAAGGGNDGSLDETK